MSRGVRFWGLLALFQVGFGLAVFGLTRAYYLERGAPAVPAHAAAGWPAPTAGNDLERTITEFPAFVRPDDPAQMLQQADARYDQGDYAGAADLYSQLIANGNADVNTYNNLGITLQYLGRADEALAVLNEGIALDGSYQRIWLTLGFVQSQAGHLDKAREALQHAVDLDPATEVGQAATEMLNNLR